MGVIFCLKCDTYPEGWKVVGGDEKVSDLKLNRIIYAQFIPLGVYNSRGDNNMKIRHWTLYEENLLQQLYGKKSIKEICKLLNRSYLAVTTKAQKLNLQNKHIR